MLAFRLSHTAHMHLSAMRRGRCDVINLVLTSSYYSPCGYAKSAYAKDGEIRNRGA